MSRELSALVHDPILSAHMQAWRSPLWRCSSLQLDEEQLETVLTQWDLAFRSPSRLERIAHILLFFSALWSGVPIEVSPSQPLHPAVSTCATLLSGEPEKAWTLRELGKRTHLSSEHLAREFKRAMGLAPMEFLARERLERGAGLLLASDDSIARIAGRVGYSDANFFARRFRAHFGVSPREYRKGEYRKKASG